MHTSFFVRTLLLSAAVLLSAAGLAAASPAAQAAPAQARHSFPKGKALADLSSRELVQAMGLGWNLGNTLDVCAADRDGDGEVNESPSAGQEVTETLWGNIPAAPELFDRLVADGFGAVRIPITWRDHLDAKNQVSQVWMDRVQAVVEMALARGLFVIINLHHDGGGDPENGAWIKDWAMDDWDRFNTRYTALWTQIGQRFAKYDEHLVFESLNEVGFDDLDKDDGYALLNQINQRFVDLVRAQGGRNATRHLLIAGYNTDVEMTASLRFQMPQDPAGRLILSLHYYTPWQFCVADRQFHWGNKQEQGVMDFKVQTIRKSFLDKGIPVLIGEYGTHPANDPADRVAFCAAFVQRCTALGIPTFLWDNGEVLDRTRLTWRLAGLLPAIQAAAGVTIP